MGCLRQEVQAAHGQRKQQLAEVATLREEERHRDSQDHEASLAGLRAEAERLRGNAQKSHCQEVEAVREKVSSVVTHAVSSQLTCSVRTLGWAVAA